MSAQSKSAFDFSKSYDEIPYDSYAYPASQASQLWAMGHLFGLQCTPFENARVLELGCAAGGNIMTAAEAFPNATFVGVDYSERQIEDGQKWLDESGITNMKLHCMSIEDITPEFGQFDYIIAHGLMSWIPRELQPQVLKVCRENLAKDGVAFVSFNAYPAWSFFEGMREMMLYHTAPLKQAAPQERAKQAKNFLKFLINNTQSKDEGYKKLLEPELELLNKQEDFYVVHDYLEDNNNPLWFKDFYQMATDAGLQYVTDSNIPTTYIGNFKPEAQAALKNQSLEHAEQYMDFLLNRRFRQAILCRADTTINRQLQPAVIHDYALTTSVTKSIKPCPVGSQIFNARGMEFNVQGAPAIEMFHILMEQSNHPMPASKLVAELSKRSNISEDEAKNVLQKYGLNMVMHGGINLHGSAGVYVKEVSEKPTISPLVRAMAANGNWANSRQCQALQLSDLDRQFMPYFNGENTVDDVVKKVCEEVISGNLPLNKQGQPLQNSTTLEDDVRDIIEQVLTGFRNNAILIA